MMKIQILLLLLLLLLLGGGREGQEVGRERMRKQTQEKQVTYNPIAPHTLTDTQLIPKQSSCPSSQLTPVYDEYDVLWNGISAVLAMLPPSFLYACFLVEHGTLKSPDSPDLE